MNSNYTGTSTLRHMVLGCVLCVTVGRYPVLLYPVYSRFAPVHVKCAYSLLLLSVAQWNRKFFIAMRQISPAVYV